MAEHAPSLAKQGKETRQGGAHHEGSTPSPVQAEKSLARASIEGSTHNEGTASGGVDTSRIPATDVAEETIMLPQQTTPGNLLVLFVFSFEFLCLQVFDLADRSSSLSLLCCFTSIARMGEEPELLEEVANIGKDTAEKATRIATAEGQG